ncbi:hypothetical protein QBC36DRAFT_294264 [Triangularia setosa]|uniref:Uncharacterized protein n=1 Tax=Triangularia setosa TaxID=2587417 RepID=A0AAN7A414_9PEZI|nr:hypothetical protein QBC36DRAFT_294264 [Podospora setosa]
MLGSLTQPYGSTFRPSTSLPLSAGLPGYTSTCPQADKRIRNRDTLTWDEGWAEREGKAKQFDEVENGVSIAGIWGHHIGHDLSWRRKRGAYTTPVAEPGRIRAYTFSLVSADGLVEYPYCYIETTRLVSWHVPLMNLLDPCGGVGECEIMLEGNVIKGRLGYHREDDNTDSGEWQVFVDIPPDGELDHGAVDIDSVDINEETDELVDIQSSNGWKDCDIWILAISMRSTGDTGMACQGTYPLCSPMFDPDGQEFYYTTMAFLRMSLDEAFQQIIVV